MLSYDELENIARLKNLILTNVEKDYVQELILLSLYSQVSSEFVFKGGTCLYKIYKLNRFSEDLDFTLTSRKEIKKIMDKIIADIALIGIKGKVKEIKEYRNEIKVRFLFNGPLYKGSKASQCFIPLNISLKEQVMLEPKKESLTSLYREIRTFDLFVMQEQEILAEKVRTILTREKPRDIYDLWFLLIKRGLSFDLDLINKKLKLYNLEFDLNQFIRAVERKKGLWQLDLKNLIIDSLPDFNEIKKAVIGRIQNRL